ncbi:MAG: formylmethanofuran dehydrogenase subunit C [Candidatus Heimdallarchaeota archaeon]|nr:formylmethanofuran dehydrogenase subunit C [Candidatus Heimdallarchaeota archaeon]
MPTVKLVLKEPLEKPKIPIEAETISPDSFVKKTLAEIGELSVWKGNREMALQELFHLSGDDFLGDEIGNISIQLEGNLAKLKRVGQKMTSGTITINSSIGMHVGFQMKGGRIVVNGDADDFAGANMKGGELLITGNAGHYLGGSVRGDWRGMSGGKIHVKGSVKNECGVWMRNGLIEIGKSAGIFLGMHLHRGIIIVNGDVTERAGAEMTGGIIVIKGTLKELLPSFEFQRTVPELTLPDYGVIKQPFIEFKGDFAEKKQGLLYVAKEKNAHLL